MPSSGVIEKTYRQTLNQAREIVSERLSVLVRATGGDYEEAAEDIAQSIVGTEQVVRLIVSTPYDRSVYRPVLLEAADEVGRTFFPEGSKRFFSPLSDAPAVESNAAEPEQSFDSSELEQAAFALPQHLRSYLNTLLENAAGSLSAARLSAIKTDLLAERLERLQRHFPDGRIPPLSNAPVADQMSDDEIILHARYVAARLAVAFPWGFFSRDTRRTGIAVNYLVMREMRKSPEAALQEDTLSYVALGLGPALRRCGGSVNRLLALGFPEQIRPWMGSHVPTGYWEETTNRRDAVRWLVEQRLGIPPEGIGRAVHQNIISKKAFREAGLTWLLKNIYGWSVAHALAESYPQLRPWECFCRVPVETWHGDAGRLLSAEAIGWVFRQEGMQVAMFGTQDAARVINSALTRWHLGAAFRIGFSENSFALLNSLFPNTFEPWEVTHVPREAWKDPALRANAVQWLLKEHHVEVEKIPVAIRNGLLSPDVFKKRGLDGLLRQMGSVWRTIDDVFPGRFVRWELGSVPNSYWRARSSVREAAVWSLSRLGIELAHVEDALCSGTLTAQALTRLGLGTLVNAIFRGDVRSMMQVAGVLPSARRVPLRRYYRQLRQDRIASHASEVEDRVEAFRARQKERRRRTENHWC
ncbi:MAG: hypothetical protein BWY06_00373 [Candidatus Latescibacteria bacterium ADurb.Bin168]|nr:MAG: hypothetical protein BWY06_00373 [Candidatus Latescibacteria bacterium ADurb.Bin168]